MAATPPEKRTTKLNAAIRNSCWIRYNGHNGIADCYCCGYEKVTRTNFDAGHVLSRAKGGSDELKNLRPVCGSCNSSMSAEHMRVFVLKNGLAGRMKDEKEEESTLVPSSFSTGTVVTTSVEMKRTSSKIACQTCKNLFTAKTLASYDGKNCYRCFNVLMTTVMNIKLVKAKDTDTVSPCCAHCGLRNEIVV